MGGCVTGAPPSLNAVVTLATSPDPDALTSVADVAGPGTDIRGGVAPDGAHSRWGIGVSSADSDIGAAAWQLR